MYDKICHSVKGGIAKAFIYNKYDLRGIDFSCRCSRGGNVLGTSGKLGTLNVSIR